MGGGADGGVGGGGGGGADGGVGGGGAGGRGAGGGVGGVGGGGVGGGGGGAGGGGRGGKLAEQLTYQNAERDSKVTKTALSLFMVCVAAALIDRSAAKPAQTPPVLPHKQENAAEGNLERNSAFEQLLDAIAIVESGGDSQAVGDSGKAVGKYQIWRIYVDDVNRILKRQTYTYDDRYDPVKSREIATIYLKYWGSRIGRPPTLEDYARIHNSGPNGYKKDCTKTYWEKVKTIMVEH